MLLPLPHPAAHLPVGHVTSIVEWRQSHLARELAVGAISPHKHITAQAAAIRKLQDRLAYSSTQERAAPGKVYIVSPFMSLPPVCAAELSRSAVPVPALGIAQSVCHTHSHPHVTSSEEQAIVTPMIVLVRGLMLCVLYIRAVLCGAAVCITVCNTQHAPAC